MKIPKFPFWLVAISLINFLSAQEISVRGGVGLDVFIANDDTTPRSADGTSFGSQSVADGGIEKTFRIRNTQSSDGIPFTGDLTVSISENSSHFSILGLPLPRIIGEDSFSDFTVRFDPSSSGRKTATIKIDNNDPDGNENPYTFRIEGTGIGVPEIEVFGLPNIISDGASISDGDTTPRSDDGTYFGTVDALGLDREHTFRIKNTGTGTLDLSGSDDSSHFQILGLANSVNPGQFDDFRVRFNPQSSGTKTATITIENNDANENPFTFRVRGVARAPEIRVRGGIRRQDTDIESGDTTPRTTDGTSFGNRDLSSAPLTRTFQISNIQSSDGLPFTGDLTVGISENSSQFSIGAAPILPIGEGSSATFTVVFNPNQIGTHRAVISIDNNDPDGNEDPFTFVVEGTGTGSPEINVSGLPNPFGDGLSISDGETTTTTKDGTHFGTVEVEGLLDKVHTFRVRNQGSAPLTVSLGDDSSQFVSTGLVPQIAPGTFDDFMIRFNPSESGTHTALITIDNNDSNENPYTFRVRGVARAPEIAVRGGLQSQTNLIESGDFTPREADGTLYNTIDVSNSTTHTFLISNLQNSDGFPLTGNLTTSITSSSSQFRIGSAPLFPIQEAQSASFVVIYDPTTPGTHRATISINNNDPDGNEDPYIFRVEGRATSQPEISISGLPNLFSDGIAIADGETTTSTKDGTHFGTVEVEGLLDKVHTFRVRNRGSAPLTVSLRDDSSQFISAGLVPEIAPGTFDEFTIRFNPSESGTHTATITIENNDPNENPYTFRVRGVARAPEIAVFGGLQSQTNLIESGDTTPREIDGTLYNTIDVSNSTTHTFLISNLQSSDGFPLTGNLTVSITENSSQFRIGSAPLLPIGEGLSAPFTVIFDPSTPGTHRATITIDNNDPDGDEDPYTFRVEGSATSEPEIQVFGQPFLLSDGVNISSGDDSPSTSDGTDFGIADVVFPIDKFQNFRVRNTGSARLTVGLSEDSSHFEITENLNRGIDPGSFDDFTITFNPSRDGVHEATVTISNNDPNESPFTFTIRGVATAPEIEVRAGLNFERIILDDDETPAPLDNTDFGSTNVRGGAIENTFQIRHRQNPIGTEGTLPLLVSTVTVDNPNFTVTAPLLPILPRLIQEGAHTDMVIRFDPFAPGVHEATVTITHNDPDGNESPYNFKIIGRADQSEIEIFGGPTFDQEIDAGDTEPQVSDGTEIGLVDLGSEIVSKTQVFQIRNTGNIPLNFSLQEDSPHYSFETEPGTVAAGASTNITLVYEPQNTGRHLVECRVFSSDLELSLFRFTVGGEAVAPLISVTDFNQNFQIANGKTTTDVRDGTDLGKVSIGGSSNSLLRVRNTGSSPLVINAAISSQDFTLIAPQDPIPAGGSASLGITFEPQSVGPKSLVVNLQSNDPSTPSYTFAISGEGIETQLEKREITTRLAFSSSRKELVFMGEAGASYRVQMSTNLKDWSPVSEQPLLTGAGEEIAVNLAEFIASSPFPRCFFRVIEQK